MTSCNSTTRRPSEKCPPLLKSLDFLTSEYETWNPKKSTRSKKFGKVWKETVLKHWYNMIILSNWKGKKMFCLFLRSFLSLLFLLIFLSKCCFLWMLMNSTYYCLLTAVYRIHSVLVRMTNISAMAQSILIGFFPKVVVLYLTSW